MKTTSLFLIVLFFTPIIYSQTILNKFKVGDVLTSKINNVEIYKSPDENSEILMKINKDEEIIYLGEDKSIYSKIKIQNIDGWIDTAFLISHKNETKKKGNLVKNSSNWIFTANRLINEKINNSNVIKIINDDGVTKEVLIGEAKFLIYKGVAIIPSEKINEPGYKALKTAIDSVYPFRIGMEHYIEFTNLDGKKYFVKLEVQLEITIDTPIGKREVALLNLMVFPLDLTANNSYTATIWVDKELLFPWGRKVLGKTFPSKSAEGSFIITEVIEN